MFGFYPLRFSFVAQERVWFPEGQAGNILRGALGHLLRETPVYVPMFKPSGLGPSGLRDRPRPFVLRARHLDGREFRAGERFHVGFHLFDVRLQIGEIVNAFERLGRVGLGPGRGRLELRQTSGDTAAPMEIDLEPGLEVVQRVRVRFVTPTELKSRGEIAGRPEFGIVAARIRDRISALRELYGPGPLELDFRAFGERAGRVGMTGCQIRQVEVVRRSSRTGQRHSIGGFIGEAEYEGELTEFVPYLRAAQWTGVGRQTVWGKGEISVECVG